MLEIKEEELKKILPSDGPSIDEVKRYLEKYNDEYIVIKCVEQLPWISLSKRLNR